MWYEKPKNSKQLGSALKGSVLHAYSAEQPFAPSVKSLVRDLAPQIATKVFWCFSLILMLYVHNLITGIDLYYWNIAN